MNNIPLEFKPYFWDTQFEVLDIRANMSYIIVRLYNEGDFQQIEWLEKTYTADDIKSVARTARGFIPIVANHLRLKYKLNKEDMAYYRNIHSMNYVYEG